MLTKRYIPVAAVVFAGVSLTACGDQDDAEERFIEAAEAQGLQCSTPEPAEVGVTSKVSCSGDELGALEFATFESEGEREQHWTGFILDREHWEFVDASSVVVGDDRTLVDSVATEVDG